ncbi:hypothetical protein QAD02_001488 [Eretmocerus hayati]|uniref:Uncharacterized protein n=1 Tax=Eretmocerus hayati TaxID=131215 RepID=A0ACC2NGJ7_9HYME|nr:hypothetical protein QAD02_001488 [Eretmocerus hayati]
MNDQRTKASLTWEFNWRTEKANVPKIENSKCLESPTFFGGAEKNSSWKMELLIKDCDLSPFRDLKLHLVTSDVRELSVWYKISVISYQRIGYPEGNRDITSVQGVKVLKMPNDCVVQHSNFIPANLFKITLCGERSIRITCNLEIETVFGKCTLNHNNDGGIPDFEKLLDHPEFSDITLIASSESFKVNKMILMTRSPVFLAMFEHDMKEKIEDTVTIPDIDPAVMRELLRCIYSGRVESFDRVDELLRAADKYQVDDLKRKCLEVLCDKITVENAVELLVAADSCSDEGSKNRIILFIVDNLKEILDTSGFDSLGDSSLLKKILRETVARRNP